MNYIVIIPARYQSSRLPGKPLIDFFGTPMIIRTYRQCLKAVPEEKIYVATDDIRIQSACLQNDIQVLMTSDNCLTGTDRVAEAALQVDADCYINVQGDEPLFNPEDLRILVKSVEKYPYQILNGYCAIKDEALFRSGTVPKVVIRPDGRLLYMSRAQIPNNKNDEFVRSWRQICAYAFPKEMLLAFASREVKTPLEEIEDIEILRFLEMGFEVQMIKMSDCSIAVDTPEDVVRVEAAIKEMDS
jgi:3-deoxy-manno-octulosonate cytidylyltransferase (CMP-KDO synthetase)